MVQDWKKELKKVLRYQGIEKLFLSSGNLDYGILSIF